MAKTIDAKANPKLDDLIAALLVIAGGWFILNQALKAAESKRKLDAPVDGAEWARTVLHEIDKAKEANGELDGEHGK
jgi:hypothetical protein